MTRDQTTFACFCLVAFGAAVVAVFLVAMSIVLAAA